MKNFTEVIIRPLLTEKSNVLSELQNKYVFQVFKNANKIEIKKSIESRFEVKVKKVSTINCKGKNKNKCFLSHCLFLLVVFHQHTLMCNYLPVYCLQGM